MLILSFFNNDNQAVREKIERGDEDEEKRDREVGERERQTEKK